jgi:hypothetical protein
MPSLPGYGEWVLANPKAFWRPNPPFVSMRIDFDNGTGVAETGNGIGRLPTSSPLTNIVRSGARFSATYTFGPHSGTIAAEIDDRRRFDVTFAGTLQTSCMAEPIATRPPAAVCRALRSLEDEADRFANANIKDAGTLRQYRANVRKYGQEMLRDVRKGDIEPGAAARAADAVRIGISGLAASSAIRDMIAAANAVAVAPRWGHLGAATAQEAFGNPAIADAAWVHFAPSLSRRHLEKTVTSLVKSSWARWGEVKSLTYGDMVWRIGPMAVTSESDMGALLVAPAGAPITEVKGLYGFKVEGEGIGPIVAAQTYESSAYQALVGAGNAAGKSVAQLEEQFAIQKFGDALKSRPAAPGGRLFDRLTKGEQGQVRIEIIESTMPNSTRGLKPLGKWGKIGRCLLVVSIAISIYKVLSAEDKLKQGAREAIGFAGGAAGGAALGAVASEFAPPAAPFLVPLATIIGGILGAMGADFVFEWVENLMTVEEQY